MAIVEGQNVLIRWSGNNRKHYESKNHLFTKIGDTFEVKISDLSNGSNFQVDVICDFCDTVHKRTFAHANKSKTHQCDDCKIRKIDIPCIVCNETFKVPQSETKRRKTCSKECLYKFKQDKIKCNCFVCDKELYKTRSQIAKSKSGNVFCSNRCVGKYNAATRKKDLVNKVCVICNKGYSVKESIATKSVTCSIECQHKWQSENLCGENANNYNHEFTKEDRMHNCNWCDKQFELKDLSKVKNKDNDGSQFFCSRPCYREWYAKVWSQTEEWKLKSAERAVKMLENGILKTDTEPQILTNEILDELNIKYKNEYNCKYVSIDNYLTEHNLMIEVMGTYWHSDPRVYKEINYQMQVDRIKNDKIKSTYIKNNYNINILYIWEGDINKDVELCKKLIISYLESKGVLNEYHSINYTLNDNGKLEISDERIVPFMEYCINDLKKIINISDSKKRSMKQEDKWIIFNCDECGKEKEQLISHYKKSKTHCCSVECASKLRSVMKKSSK